MSDDDDDEGDLLAGLARPQISMGHAAMGGADADDSGDESESEAEGAGGGKSGGAAPKPPGSSGGGGGGGETGDSSDDGGSVLPGADTALGSLPALELDPFRVAAGADVAGPSSAGDAQKRGGGGGGGGGKHLPCKIFVGGLSHATTEDELLKFFARYGKVREAKIVGSGGGGGGSGGSRGFGFIDFVNEKGARYCLQQVGDPPSVSIGGREVTVRYAQAREKNGAGMFKMPARGNVDYLGHKAQRERERAERRGGWAADDSAAVGDPGVAAIASAHKRAQPGGSGGGGVEAADGEGSKRRKKKEIVTVSRRQDAEPLYDKPITMKEIFPKEFWRI